MHDAGRRTLEHLQNARELRKLVELVIKTKASQPPSASSFLGLASRIVPAGEDRNMQDFSRAPQGNKKKTSEWQMVYLKWWIKCKVVLCGSNLCWDSCTFWTCTWSVTSSSAAWLKSMCRGWSRFSRKAWGDEVVVVENTEGEDWMQFDICLWRFVVFCWLEFEYSDIFVQDMYILYSGTMDVQAQLSKSFQKACRKKGGRPAVRELLQVKGIKVGTLEGGSAPQVSMRTLGIPQQRYT